MKKLILFIINFIAGLAFCIATCGIDSEHMLPCSIVILVCISWFCLFIYANLPKNEELK